MDQIETEWKAMNSLNPVSAHVFGLQLDNSSGVKLMSDMFKVVGLVSFFSVFISCLGLLGMAIFDTRRRTKEIGIRKVLGAENGDMLKLLSRSYVIMLLIAIVLAVPFSMFINNLWLENFANRIDLDIWILASGVLLTSIIAMVTVGSQTLKASRLSPIKNLRYE